MRLLPPRAKGPTLTVALASIEIRTVCSSASASSLICFTWAKMASVSGSLDCGLTLGHLFWIIPQFVQLGGDRLRRGQFVVTIATLRDQLAAHFRCRQTGIQTVRARIASRLRSAHLPES